jgi:hypothetical protein
LGSEDKIWVSRKFINKIKIGLKDIKLNEKSKILRKQISEMIDMIDRELSDSDSSIEEKILKKMKETKKTDPDMNANLYILYRNFKSGRIDESQAIELYNMYVKIEPYERTID